MLSHELLLLFRETDFGVIIVVQLLCLVQLFTTHGLKYTRLPCSSQPPGVFSVSSNYLILCRPLLLLPSIFPSSSVFSNESALHIMWPKYWSFSFHIGLSNEYSGLISFRIDWFDFLAVQGTLKSLFQHHNSKVSILDTKGLTSSI